MSTTKTTTTPETTHRPDPGAVVKAIEKRSFMNLATVSESGAPLMSPASSTHSSMACSTSAR